MQKETKNKKALVINIFIALFLVSLIFLLIYFTNFISYLEIQNYVANLANVSFFNVLVVNNIFWLKFSFMAYYLSFPIIFIIFILVIVILLLINSLIKNYHKNHILKKNLLIFLVLTIILFVVFMISAYYYYIFSVMNNIIMRGPAVPIWTGIPYNNSYIYTLTNFTLIFPRNYAILSIPNNTIVPIMFYIENQKQIRDYGWTPNLKILKALPKITINYRIIKNNSKITFYIVNESNYINNITINDLPLKNFGLVPVTFGVKYNNNFYMFLGN